MDRLFATFTKQFKGNPKIFADWKKLTEDSRDSPVPDKLRRVNEFFNRHIEFSDDQQIWGQSDYWATPMETLAKGQGDCEDFTIAKYFTLLNMNVPIERLRLVYVKARIGGPSSGIQQAHMVLTYYPSPDVEPLVLDNLISDIRPASRRTDLQPVFSFNSQGIYSGIAADSAAGPGGVGQLSRWAALLQATRAEGFD
ncbi:MAG: transglutaminase [Burkholderiales bacterium RIFCSPLOWO2_02_FULL_57_36]|nr:MAG: transglutaminase [Burkholderiales bacterium RIFCSPLOWO2_02_FULL_57_36]